MPKYITTREFAELHGVSQHAVRRMVRTGGIPGAKRVDLPGPPRRADHVWIIPQDAPYEKRKPGPKPGTSIAKRIAEEYSDPGFVGEIRLG